MVSTWYVFRRMRIYFNSISRSASLSNMKNFLIFFAAILLFASCSTKQNSKTIYLVRHAEKQLVGSDPGLAKSGQIRAKKLAQILADKNIKHIYSTDYIRTRSTAAPTAEAAGLIIEIYDPKNHDSLVEQIRILEGNVLVIGHSNTVNQLVNYFVGEGEKYDDLTDLEYDFIFEVTLKGSSATAKKKLYKDF